MLVLTRKVGERLVIGDQIVVTIVQVDGTRVRVGVEAPSDVNVVRSELLAAEERESAARKAAHSQPA